jgi:hypothetical protein
MHEKYNGDNGQFLVYLISGKWHYFHLEISKQLSNDLVEKNNDIQQLRRFEKCGTKPEFRKYQLL